MASKRTNDLKKKRTLFGILSYGVWIVTILTLVICAFATYSRDATIVNETMQIVTDDAKNWVIGLGTTAVIALGGAIIIKDKMRTVVWMISLVLATVMYNRVGMFIILGL